MRQDRNFVVRSLELHLFFARIMKEHSLFLRAGFTPVDAAFAREAEFFKQEFERVLSRAAALGNGVVGKEVLDSGEVVTEFTATAERQTQRLTGIAINQNLTARLHQLRCGDGCPISADLFRQVRRLNQTALRLLDGLISLKERILCRVKECRMFTANYPLLLEHILREAKLYRDYVCHLEEHGDLDCQTMAEVEQFWNKIMMEHALFIRGLLDPTECALIEKADCFAKDYAKLLEASCAAQDKANENVKALTCQLRDFKAAGAKGITGCEIRSIILPLLADHVLREANHYLRLLCE